MAAGFPSAFSKGRKAFYRLQLIGGQEGENGQKEQQLEYLELTGEEFPEPVRIIKSQETESGYLMQEPVYAEAMFPQTDGQTGAVSLLSCLSQVSARSVAVLNADAKTVREYGLEKPQVCIRYRINGEEHRLMVGKQQKDQTRYLMADEDKNIYVADKEQVSAWAEAEVMDLRTSYIWLVDVNRLDALLISDGTKTYEFGISREEGTEEITVHSQGREINAAQTFLPFYQKLLGMTVMRADKPEKWEEIPAYSITYCFTEESGKEPLTVSFCKAAEGDGYAAFVDEKFAGVLRINTVEEIMELTGRVDADEKVN